MMSGPSRDGRRRRAGRVIDVGGNVGWYTLYSLALGCRVSVVEPVPLFQQVLRLGLSLNPGFAQRVTIYDNVVHYRRGAAFNVSVPLTHRYQFEGKWQRRKMGMAGVVVGEAGEALKRERTREGGALPPHELHAARAVTLDELAPAVDERLCGLKVDVEGLEPQVCLRRPVALRG